MNTEVFPTRVGMFRRISGEVHRRAGFPHARGDVPSTPATFTAPFVFSPRAWGCSVLGRRQHRDNHVFPTRVGMFRFWRSARSTGRSFPHARGDVPKYRYRKDGGGKFSPRAWGCSFPYKSARGKSSVFPTRVGMFRRYRKIRCREESFPHARGDVPYVLRSFVHAVPFSPRAWGCSAWSAALDPRGAVFPTRVGMFRLDCKRRFIQQRFPHARGDVPLWPHGYRCFLLFSPRAWGCSGIHAPRSGVVKVFPTRVGMFRLGPCCLETSPGFPHARGDVPPASGEQMKDFSFSPRAWGCSGMDRGRRRD